MVPPEWWATLAESVLSQKPCRSQRRSRAARQSTSMATGSGDGVMDYSVALKGYEKFEFNNGRWTREVYRRGSGPAVIVIHEIPGLHPAVIRFADRVGAG